MQDPGLPLVHYSCTLSSSERTSGRVRSLLDQIERSRLSSRTRCHVCTYGVSFCQLLLLICNFFLLKALLHRPEVPNNDSKPPTQCPTYLPRRCSRASGAYQKSGNKYIWVSRCSLILIQIVSHAPCPRQQSCRPMHLLAGGRSHGRYKSHACFLHLSRSPSLLAT